MTRYVRFEEIDGDLVLRVPADVAAELGFVAGDEAVVSGSERGLEINRVDAQDQLSIGRAVAQRHREALARLAR